MSWWIELHLYEKYPYNCVLKMQIYFKVLKSFLWKFVYLFHMQFHIFWTMFVNHLKSLIIFISQIGFFRMLSISLWEIEIEINNHWNGRWQALWVSWPMHRIHFKHLFEWLIKPNTYCSLKFKMNFVISFIP